MIQLSVVIPTLNERPNIQPIFDGYWRAWMELTGKSFL